MLIDMFLQMQGRFDELDSELKKANDNTQKILEQLVLAKKAYTLNRGYLYGIRIK